MKTKEKAKRGRDDDDGGRGRHNVKFNRNLRNATPHRRGALVPFLSTFQLATKRAYFLPDGSGARISLVRAQGRPFLIQSILLFEVILHVGLERANQINLKFQYTFLQPQSEVSEEELTACIPYQNHVTGGDVHVGQNWLFTPV